MFVTVIATPLSGVMRVGERFRLQPGMPLRVGTAREARIRLEGHALLVDLTFDGTNVSLRGGAAPGRLVNVPDGELRDGSLLFVDSTLVLRFHAQPLRAPARHLELERALVSADADDPTWDVYADFLEEHGDPLASVVRAATPNDEPALLGALALHAPQLDLQWGGRRLARSLMVTNDTADLAWVFAQLPRAPVLRLLRDVRVDWLAGGAPRDAEAATLLSSLRGLDHLRSVKLGIVTEPQSWPLADAAWRALGVAGDWVWRIPSGARARLTVHANTSAVAVDGNVILNPMRTDVGTAPGCLVRLLGDAPRVACTLRRMPEGEWVVSNEGFALRVNGAPVTRAVLRPGDVLEPVPGLQLRFELPV